MNIFNYNKANTSKRLINSINAITKIISREYFYFSEESISTILDYIDFNNVKSVLVVDDAGLQIVNKLLTKDDLDITLTFYTGSNDSIFDHIVYFIKDVYKNININFVNFKDINTMKFDLIIANPPYGKIGANITKNIIDNVDFSEYVNLLPANDYKRNTEKNLYNFQSDMKPLDNTKGQIFEDAAVTTHLAKIHKTKVNNMTLDEFERSQYIDRQLDKYFEENSKRSHYAIDSLMMPLRLTEKSKLYSPAKDFLLGLRDMNHMHLPYSKKADTYKWNVEKSITVYDIVTLHPEKLSANEFHHHFISFNSEQEKQNFVNLIYSKDGFRFISKVFTALNIDGSTKPGVFPKVDWTRSWTVEEILADYGYDEKEIQDIMNSLDKFKGMED